jgi:hypothetical protein
VSDVPVNDNDDKKSNSKEDVGSGDKGSDDKETEDTVFHHAAQEIMNRAGRRVGRAVVEDRRFRSFFGARFEIVRMVWGMLGGGGLHPEKSKPKHLLWTLYFLKVYPREGPGCVTVGGWRGAVDPRRPCKTADPV